MAEISDIIHEKMRRCELVDSDKGSKIQVVVCDICGDRGFENALMYCSKCSATAVHQYCLGLQPGIIDDTCDWFCEYCCPSMEFDSGATYTIPATIFVEPSVALETKSKQDKNVIFHVVEELEPLSILPPVVVHHGNFEEKETNHQVTLGTHTLNYSGVCELSTSSFIEYPKEIGSGLILLVSQTGEITICSGNGFCDVSQPQVDEEESEVLATLLECPEAFASGYPTISSKNETINCNAMNSNKTVNEGCCRDEPGSQMDKEIDTHPCIADKEIDTHPCIADTIGKENSSDAGGDRIPVVVGLPTENMDHLRCAKRKRNASAVKFDLIPNLGPDCKRRRSRRRKMSSTSNREINGCKLSFSSVSAIVDERSDLPSNDPKAILLGSEMDGMDHDDTFSKTTPLVVDKSHVGAISEYCGQDALKEYDVEVQKLKANLADEKKRLDEALKKSRRTIWKVVHELETTKKVLEEKKIELAKKTTEVEMIKNLSAKEFQASSQLKKEALELWLAGFCEAKNVIYQFHPELKNEGVEDVGNLMLLRHQ